MISLTREQYLDSIRKLRDEASSFADRLSTAQLTWQPMGGARWSVAECLDHLAVFNTGYLAALESAASNAPSGGRAGETRAAPHAQSRKNPAGISRHARPRQRPRS